MEVNDEKSGGLKEFFHNKFVVRLQISLNSIFLTLIFIFALVVYGFTYYSSREQLNELSVTFSESISTIIQRSITSVIYRTEGLGEIISNSINGKSYVTIENTQLIYQMLTLLQQTQYIDRLGFATEDGTFLSAISLVATGISHYHLQPTKSLPPNCIYAIRQVIYEGQNKGQVWHYMDANFNVIDEETSSSPPFDVREYPWYTTIKKWPDSRWDNTIIAGTDEKALSFVVPEFDDNNQFYGALRIVISWNKLVNLINLQKVGKSGWAFLFYKNGDLIAPAPGNAIDKEFIIKKIREKIDGTKNFNQQIALKVDDKSYIVNLYNIPIGYEFGWELGIVVPLDDIFGPFLMIERQRDLLSLSLLALFGVAIYYLSGIISYPITRVAKQVDLIKNFNFEESEGIKSRIWEIVTLTNSVKSMRSALSLFAKYIPLEVVRAVLKSKEDHFEIKTDRRDMTMLFSDIENFTTISESLSSENLIRNLSEYFGIFSKIIHKNEGTIDKYIGDSMMAFWNAPMHVLDHGEKACLTALEFLKCTHNKNDSNPLLKNRTRFGIHSGEVLVGNIGTEERLNYTVIGNAVNTASRLENLCKIYGSNILISESTHEKIGLRFITRPIDYIVVKGRTRGITIYELIGLREENKKISATEDEIKLAEEFTLGFQAFQTGKHEQAKTIFKRINELFPEDTVTKIYLEKLQ
jgi:adenylate cyclase